MFIPIFIVAVVVSAFFDQQRGRHKMELEIEYQKLGRTMPAERPRLPMLESIANVLVGVILVEIGGVGLLGFLSALRDAGQVVPKFHPAGQIDFLAGLLAGGIALTILGVKSLRTNLAFRKSPGLR